MDDVVKFDPFEAQLNEIVATTSTLTKESDLEVVHDTRIKLRDIRVSITKFGKEKRDASNAYNKKVLEEEKRLIEIVSPEEDRLQKIEDDVKAEKIRAERMEKLPSRKEKLEAIDHRTAWATDDELLAMDSEAFEKFYSSCIEEHERNIRVQKEEAERKKLEEEQAKLDADRKALDEEKRIMQEEKDKLARAKEIEDAKAQAVKDAEEKRKREEADAKAEKEAEQKKLEKRSKYVAFLNEHGYTKETSGDFKTEETETGYKLYKLVGIFNK